jgi:hypothetical protein
LKFVGEVSEVCIFIAKSLLAKNSQKVKSEKIIYKSALFGKFFIENPRLFYNALKNIE